MKKLTSDQLKYAQLKGSPCIICKKNAPPNNRYCSYMCYKFENKLIPESEWILFTQNSKRWNDQDFGIVF